MSTGTPKSEAGEPTWEVAALFPTQGNWSVSEYLSLSTNRLVELDNGRLEFLPMPTELHQLIAFYLCSILRNLGNGDPPGLAVMAPFRVRVCASKFREPDVAFMLREHRERRNQRFWDGADLVIEIVSEDEPERDFETKRAEYAKAGIPEYWIVDPRDRTIYVLELADDLAEYLEAGKYTIGDIACSVLLQDFRVEVSSVFDQGCGPDNC